MKNNLLTNAAPNLPEEMFVTLVDSNIVKIEKIVSHGHTTPVNYWYDQVQNEWVLLLKGAARLKIEDELVELTEGDCINIPAHRKHRVEWTTPDEPTIWLAVHYD